ncbi:Protein CBG15221 [Caenorhabditis briggsae]|uniref:RNA helicase n=2 Tax=Caenorhabditis briggsae TaxID=6238 RepID=A0AAE9EGF5_CAEBR|nr:Protein CBG15221 [Caenorhabditis briggsae]ULT98435.1 hypothetical protein L3Y34_000067 [Caenorhabditis briggsae]UMM21147.1 hypothetical protein L5515_002953 [Caenorhabditis briggsae]CAP33531.2 Protein CBG15221 [Caenorhabditis briggsae]
MSRYHPGHGQREHRGSAPTRRGFARPSDAADEPRTGPLILEEKTTETTSSAGPEDQQLKVFNNPYASLNIQQQRIRLPIFKNRGHILYMCERYRTLIIVGETGCGKSTQVPQFLLEFGWADDGRQIAITQPRRVAVVTLATRVAEETDTLLGHNIGYTVRFDDVSDEATKVKFMTDGLLLREILQDPMLSKYSIIMIDEAHERSCNTDILLGLLRKIMQVRNDLRIIVSSATLDAELFRDFFEMNETGNPEKDTAAILSVEGRTHPVAVHHTKTPVPNYCQAAVDTVINIHKHEMPGDILVFLTGQDEVEDVCEKLREEARKLRNCDKLWVVPCYGALPASEQMKAFDSTPHGTRKVVVATNIAEASITIPGICYVIDTGYVKLRAVNANNGVESLMRVTVSQASAEQRAGRAGRIRPGKCYRLYPESEFRKFSEGTIPEIQRCHLAATILQLKALGVQNVHKFHYLSPPPSWSMIQGLELLYALGAIDESSQLTDPLGLQMAEFPLPPMHSKCLLKSAEFGCSDEIVTIVAMMQIQDVFLTPFRARHQADIIRKKFSVEEGDHMTMLNVFTKFVENGRSKKWCSDHFVNYRGLMRADNVRSQLVRLLKRFEIPKVSCRGLINASENIRQCLVTGFFSQAAQYHYTGKYMTVKENFPFNVYKGSSIMFKKDYPKWVIFTEVMQDSIRDVTVIEPEWLYELAPHYYEFGTEGELAEKRMRGGQ